MSLCLSVSVSVSLNCGYGVRERRCSGKHFMTTGCDTSIRNWPQEKRDRRRCWKICKCGWFSLEINPARHSSEYARGPIALACLLEGRCSDCTCTGQWNRRMVELSHFQAAAGRTTAQVCRGCSLFPLWSGIHTLRCCLRPPGFRSDYDEQSPSANLFGKCSRHTK